MVIGNEPNLSYEWGYRSTTPEAYVNLLKEVYPAVKDHIEEIEVATPQTFARYTGAYDGIVYGYEPEPWDSVVPRALAMKKERFVQGLYFCGGFSYRCHGYGSSILSGKDAGETAVKDLESGMTA